MVLFTRSGPDAALRLGVVASRRVGNAVARARAKRLLREVYRLNRHDLEGACDIVLVARDTILRCRWNELQSDFLRATARTGLRRGDTRKPGAEPPEPRSDLPGNVRE